MLIPDPQKKCKICCPLVMYKNHTLYLVGKHVCVEAFRRLVPFTTWCASKSGRFTFMYWVGMPAECSPLSFPLYWPGFMENTFYESPCEKIKHGEVGVTALDLPCQSNDPGTSLQLAPGQSVEGRRPAGATYWCGLLVAPLSEGLAARPLWKRGGHGGSSLDWLVGMSTILKPM